ncbi:MBL fold metallo-hydrolase [Pedobacter sp. MC2016-24]|uniref:MBL fold metallo-hydrolase n=1 Tax=Pedobacter sp. MC2016-24 TaxID=2780090 RepID=UPI00187F2287|nr:MBL fold metallo-hydrolase [Pedobacter sp. MC2016-24]MBE9601026.1 MBL fold metallo-hydrolase [Pedobacter sp. MC2016-24]
MNLHTINTGLFKLDGGAMFGVVPKSIWQRSNPADANNMCTWAMRCLLIEDGDRLILIDNGIGDKQDEKFLGHYYLHGDDTLDKSLAAKGFSRNDITDVFLTHLHFDHCGGSIVREGDKLRPAFKNAFYWSNAKHWDWAVNPNDREKASFLKENILPIQESGQLRFIADQDGIAFHEGIQVRFAYGHTDAMMLPQIQYKDKTIIYVADLLPSVGHIPLPYVMAYDMFPLQTLKEKKAFLNEAADRNYILYLEHDPIHECCTLQQTEKGVRLNQTFDLSDI